MGKKIKIKIELHQDGLSPSICSSMG